MLSYTSPHQLSQTLGKVCIVFHLSYHHGSPGHRLEGFSEAFDMQIDFVSVSEVQNQHVIVSTMNYIL